MTFFAAPDGMDVVLEAHEKAGLITSGRDVTNVLRVDYHRLARWIGWLSCTVAWSRWGTAGCSSPGMCALAGRLTHTVSLLIRGWPG